MSKSGKTLINIGSFLLLASLLPLIVIGVLMVSVQYMDLPDLPDLKYDGGIIEWIRILFHDSIESITAAGISILILASFTYFFIIAILVMESLEHITFRRIAYVLAGGVGLIMVILSLVPLIALLSTSDPNPISVAGVGILTAIIGVNSLWITIGSGLCLVTDRKQKLKKQDEINKE